MISVECCPCLCHPLDQRRRRRRRKRPRSERKERKRARRSVIDPEALALAVAAVQAAQAQEAQVQLVQAIPVAVSLPAWRSISQRALCHSSIYLMMSKPLQCHLNSRPPTVLVLFQSQLICSFFYFMLLFFAIPHFCWIKFYGTCQNFLFSNTYLLISM